MGTRLPLPRLPRRVRGLLLDTCNVLYDDTVWRRWLLKLLAHVGLHTNYRCFFRVWDLDYLGEVHRGRRRFRQAFESFLRSAGLSRGQIDEVEAASEARRRQIEAGTRPLPGVKTTLARLHKSGFVLGAIGNSEHPAAELRRRLERFGINRLFTAVVSSIDLGQTMPHQICFRTALEEMNLPAEQVAFVDHDAAELAGAAAMGMSTVAFNYDPDARADVYLARFEELVELLASEGPLAAAG